LQDESLAARAHTGEAVAERRRALMLIAGSAVLSAGSLAFVALHLAVTRPVPWANVAVLAVGGCVFGGVALVQRRMHSTRLGGTIACGSLFAVVAMLAARHGIHAPALLVLILLPMLGIFFVGARVGIGLAIAGMVMVAAAWLLDEPGHPLRGGMNRPQIDRVHAVLVVILIGAVTNMAWLFEKTRAAAHALMAQGVETIAAARDEAQLADRAKSAFLATVSHEIRTPLNGVVGGLSLLEGTRLSADQRRSVDIARQSSATLLQLVDAILDMSRYEAGSVGVRTAPAELRAIIEGVVSVNMAAAEAKGVALSATVGADVPRWLELDATRVKQILNNLVSNGVKFTAQGRVELRVDVGDVLGRTVELAFEVHDTGIGMTDETMARVFKPFVQADAGTTRRYGGAGLGLAISKRLVEAMQGRIEASSEPGKGSVFKVSLPVGVAREPAVAPTPTESPRVARHLRGQVLVIDDNEVNAEVVVRLLAALGVGAATAVDGRSGLDAIAADAYDAVLMDCSMPQMDGFEATRRLRAWEKEQQQPRVPVIGLTAHAVDYIRLDCLDAGMDDVRSKPVTLDVLRGALSPYLPSHSGADAGAGREQDEAVLEDGFFEDLYDQLGEAAPSFCRRLVGVFADSAARDIAAIDTARRGGDLEQVAFHAHRLKGSAGNVGARALGEAAKNTDAAARAKDSEAVQTHARDLEELLSATLRELAASPVLQAGRQDDAEASVAQRAGSG